MCTEEKKYKTGFHWSVGFNTGHTIYVIATYIDEAMKTAALVRPSTEQITSISRASTTPFYVE